MRKWWWLPGWHKKWRIESVSKRNQTLLADLRFSGRTRLSALGDSQALSTKRLFTLGVPDRLFVGATPPRDLYGQLPRDDRQRL